MRSAEARNMPDPSKGPESERRPKLIDGAGQEKMETKENAGASFAADADEFVRLQDRAVAKALELSKLEENPLGAGQEQAKAALQKEMDSIQRSIDAVVDKYGDGAEDFVADAMSRRDLELQIAAKKAKLAELNKMTDFTNYPGGQRGADAEMDWLADRVIDLSKKSGDLERARDAQAKMARAEVAKISNDEIDSLVSRIDNPFADLKDEEIDAALSIMEAGAMERTHVDKSGKELSEVEMSLRELQEMHKQDMAEQAKMSKETAEALEMAKEASAEALREKELESAIASATSLEELKAAVDKAGDVTRSDGKKYDKVDLGKMIDFAAEAPIVLGMVTRKHGLRDKLRSLVSGMWKQREGAAKIMEPVGSFDDGSKPLDAAQFEAKKEPQMSGEELDAALRALPRADGKQEPILLTPDMKKKKPSFSEAEEAFFSKGEQISKDNADGWMEVEDHEIIDVKFPNLTDEEIDSAFAKAESGALERRAVESSLEKNELAPEQKEALQHDLQRLSNELFSLQKGIELRVEDPISGKERWEYRPGLEELEKQLAEYGVDVNALDKAKNDEEFAAIMKKETSMTSTLKRGLKYLLSPGYRKTMDLYERRVKEIADVEDQIAGTKLMLENPQKAAEDSQRRYMRTMLLRAKRKAAPQRSPGSPFSLRF